LSVSLSPHPLSLIVARLRAAGCVFAEDEAQLLIREARTAAQLDALICRRVAGLPLEHVLGWAEFAGLRVVVDPGVFVPRRRTEFLVAQAVAAQAGAAHAVALPAAHAVVLPAAHAVVLPAAHLPRPYDHSDAPDLAISAGKRRLGRGSPGPRPAQSRADQSRADQSRADQSRAVVVLDLCCGSGAIGMALVAVLGRVELHAADIDPAAVRCARRNIAGAGQVYQGDLYQPLPETLRGRVNVVVANAPYVPTEAIGLLPSEARLHEPRVALDGGTDGQDILRRVAAAAPLWLAPGGHLLVETSERQAALTAETLARTGLITRVAHSEEFDATVVIGTKRP
jgi:release factor glutamine methyltransferase